jgi:opacity protein-like surface antigen
MKPRYLLPLAALSIAWSAAALAERQPGWDAGADLIYQDSQDITFNGGSAASLDDDLGLALTFGYRFNSRLELLFGLDWNNLDYDINIVADGIGGRDLSASGELESFTPYFGLSFNILEGDFTPYVEGTVGWAFIDTNIPDGPPQSACWWDPWWGYVCGSWQDSRSLDELTYAIGAGIRWDASSTLSLRFGYEKHWLDLGEATSTPDFDQLRLGVMVQY